MIVSAYYPSNEVFVEQCDILHSPGLGSKSPGTIFKEPLTKIDLKFKDPLKTLNLSDIRLYRAFP